MTALLLLLDYAGVAVFAATGALAASRKQLDVIGFLYLAAVTGIGGGTFRDLILGTPVFWVVNPAYVLVCAAVAVIVFFTAHLVESRYRLLLWLDAVGMSAYAVMGAAKGLAASGSPTVAVVMGMLTATFGGMLRDMLSSEPSVLLRKEIYVTAALVGAAVYTLMAMLGLQNVIAAVIAFAAAFLVRGGALRFGWSFPPYRSRPGRPPEDI
ncbi:MAG: trimeric intracellular cation channel family protein [Rhizobiaceae bacterium]